MLLLFTIMPPNNQIFYHIQLALADSHSFFFQFGHSAAFVRSIFKPGTVKKPIELCVDSAPPTECGNVGCSFDPKNLIELLTTFCNLEMYSQTRQVVNRQALKYQDLMHALYTDGNIYITQVVLLYFDKMKKCQHFRKVRKNVWLKMLKIA